MSVAWADDDDARAWLERMSHALATRNYDGTFFHLRNGRVETLRIVHRVADGKVVERLVSLDGSGREIIRNDQELTCYLPDQRRVLVESRPEGGSLLAALPTFDSSLEDHYRVESSLRARLLGRLHSGDCGKSARRLPFRLPTVDRRGHCAAAQDATVRRKGKRGRADPVREHRGPRQPA